MISFSQSEEFLIHMRIVDPHGEEIDDNRLSSGRIGLTDYYYSKYKKRPFIGYGFGDKPKFIGTDVHIVWLKNAVNGGTIYLLLLIGIFISIYVRVRAINDYLGKEEMKLFYSLFFISMIITFLEPNYLIGSVQGEFVYWLLIGLLMKRPMSSTYSKRNNLPYQTT